MCESNIKIDNTTPECESNIKIDNTTSECESNIKIDTNNDLKYNPWTDDKIRSFLKPNLRKTYSPKHPTFQSFIDLIKYHEIWGERLDDIKSVRVIKSKLNKKANLLQIKTNKIWFTISWKQCVKRKKIKRKKPFKTTSEKQMECAMRNAIRRQITMWKNKNNNNQKCQHCHLCTNLHVDHFKLPFSIIKSNFLSQFNKEQIPTEFNLKSARNVPKVVFLDKDKGFKQQWQKYHKVNATYQWLCGSCNTKKSNHIPNQTPEQK